MCKHCSDRSGAVNAVVKVSCQIGSEGSLEELGGLIAKGQLLSSDKNVADQVLDGLDERDAAGLVVVVTIADDVVVVAVVVVSIPPVVVVTPSVVVVEGIVVGPVTVVVGLVLSQSLMMLRRGLATP